VSGSGHEEETRRVVRQLLSELVPANGSGNGNGTAAAHGNGPAPARGNGSGHAPAPVPQVPAPPVAAVLRPSTWKLPPAPGEVIGRPGPGGAQPAPPAAAGPAPAPAPVSSAAIAAAAPAGPAGAPAGGPPVPVPAPAVANPGGENRVEVVSIDTDEDLMAFVRQLISRVANPRDRLAIHTGKLRFALRRRPAGAAGGAAAAGSAAPVTRVEKGAVTERVIRDAASAGASLVLAPAAVLTPLARERARALGVEIERERRC
jgi:hypothetical protein